MALAEARAAWQRTANRWLVQEDAKRTPRLACCSSVPPSAKQDETGPTNATSVQDIPSSNSLPCNRNPSYCNLSPSSRWRLQLQPNYMYQKGLMEHFASTESNTETSQIQECSGGVAKNEVDSMLVDQTLHVESLIDKQCRNFITCGKKDFKDEKLRSVYNRNPQDALKLEFKEDVKELRNKGLVNIEVLKNSNDLFFNSETSCVGAEKNSPWWLTADTEELALLVAQRSLDLLDNCDLPMPQNTHVKKNLDDYGRCLSHEEMSTSLLVRKTCTGRHHRSYTHNFAAASLTAGSYCQKLEVVAANQLRSGSDKSFRDRPTHKRKPETHASDDDTSKAQLLEALRHSQTRAREAEKVAKQACAEKEHAVKLVLRQTSQLFAYKQWHQLLQLENVYFQFKNNKTLSASAFFPKILHRTTSRIRKMQKGWPKSSSRKWAKQARPWCDASKYAIVFALGLGLVSAGLLLGWTIGWMLPLW